MEIPKKSKAEFKTGLERNIHVLRRSDIERDMDRIAPLYAELNTAAFALEEPTETDEAIDKLSHTDLLLLASDDENNPVGFATYQCIPSAAGNVIYQARGLTAESRGLGLGRSFPRIAARELSADYLIAKAQNPISIWSTIASELFETVLPIDGDFTDSPEMQQVLLDTVAFRGKTGGVDLRTGIHRGSYPMGKLGDYAPDLSHPGVAAVQARLDELGIDSLAGDAVYSGGKIV